MLLGYHGRRPHGCGIGGIGIGAVESGLRKVPIAGKGPASAPRRDACTRGVQVLPT